MCVCVCLCECASAYAFGLCACVRAYMSMCLFLRVCLCRWMFMYLPYVYVCVCVCVCVRVRVCSRREVRQGLGTRAPLVLQVYLVALSGGMQGLRCKAWPALSPPVLGHLFSCLVYRDAWRQGREAEAWAECKPITSGRNLLFFTVL